MRIFWESDYFVKRPRFRVNKGTGCEYTLETQLKMQTNYFMTTSDYRASISLLQPIFCNTARNEKIIYFNWRHTTRSYKLNHSYCKQRRAVTKADTVWDTQGSTARFLLLLTQSGQ